MSLHASGRTNTQQAIIDTLLAYKDREMTKDRLTEELGKSRAVVNVAVATLCSQKILVGETVDGIRYYRVRL